MCACRYCTVRAACSESCVMNSAVATDIADGCRLTVRVHPGARKNGVTGIHADAVKIALTAPPVDGKANEALIAFLAGALRLRHARVSPSSLVPPAERRWFTLQERARPRLQPRSFPLKPAEHYLIVSFAVGATVILSPSVAVTFRFEAVTSAYAICSPLVA
jgi:uncharacterized protein (TIGR00251 family)